MTHDILLLRTNVVVIIRYISDHHFGFLHHINSAWSLLLKEILALLRADRDLSILGLVHDVVGILKLSLLVGPKLLKFFIAHLFSS